MAACAGVADPNLTGQFFAVIGQDVFHFLFALGFFVAESDEAGNQLRSFVSHACVISQNMAKIVLI